MTGRVARDLAGIVAAALAVAALAVAALGVAALAAPTPAAAQLTLRLAVPAGTPADSVHVAGTFNGWNPAHPAFRLRRAGAVPARVPAPAPGGAADTFVLTLPADVRGTVEFKLALGSWDRVEVAADGSDVANRRLTVPETGRMTYADAVAAWRDPSRPAPAKVSTRTAGVTVLADSFPMPELGRVRRVWVYLPPGYASSSERFPVLYMADGQNLFDDATSYSGEWGVDETLDSLAAAGGPRAIVVGTDHGVDRRMDEYSPWVNAEYGGGEGAAWLRWLVDDVKPAIDSLYRTIPDRRHTAIAGSSMGGMISLYALLERPDVFGMAGVFSPAFWFAPEVFPWAADRAPSLPDDARVYFVSGGQERVGERTGVYEFGQRRMVELLEDAGLDPRTQIRARVPEDGTHSEWFWRREFPSVFLWLFDDRRPR